jgi:AcrR family transcriptional regulator
VGDIEAAAGLEPRRGALYRHYPSKEALLEASLEQHLQNLADAGASLDQLPAGDIRDQAISFGRWLLAELDREETIMRILEQDGDRLPGVRNRFRERLVDPGYAIIADLVRTWLCNASKTRSRASKTIDLDAVSAILLGGLINYRRSTWTFQVPPAGLDQERYLAGWADLCCTAVKAVHRRTRATRPT